MKMNLQAKLVVPAAVMLIVGMLILGSLSYVNSKNTLREEMTQNTHQLTELISVSLDEWLNDIQTDIRTIGQQPLFVDLLSNPQDSQLQNTACQQFANVVKNYSCYETVFLTDTHGDIVASAIPGHIGKINISDRGYFHKSLQGQTVVSDVIKSKGSGKPIFVVSVPAPNHKGVVVAAVRLDYFSESFLANLKFGKTGIVSLLNNSGVVISHPDNSLILNQDITQFDWGQQIVKTQNGSLDYTLDGIKKFAVYKLYPEKNWIITATLNHDEIFSSLSTIKYITLLTTGVLMIVLTAVLFFLTSWQIVKPVQSIIDDLETNATQISSASQQIAAGSRQLAEGAIQQAAGLEEASSSLEEMSSMTKQNADNAQQANTLSDEAQQSADEGGHAMERMNESIKQIQKSSSETAKIIKVIDEIAFQTNLLALNAAVEAARAGEAGKGFAVVAEEVRNLAMRSAEAARDTSHMIQESVKTSNNGVEIATEVSSVLSDIVEKVSQTSGLVTEIAAASQEQAQGVQQVNETISQMEKTTQTNAASAEESSSSSEELNTQSRQLNTIVNRLTLLVGNSLDSPKKGNKKQSKSLKVSDSTFHHIAGGKRQTKGETRNSAIEKFNQ